MQNFCVLTILLASLFAGAPGHAQSLCPWEKQDGLALFKFNYDPNKSVDLSAQQVAEDLACLRIVLINYYSLLTAFPNNSIVQNLDQSIQTASPISSQELLNQIFSFHKSYPDLHLAYESGGVNKSFKTEQPNTVTLSENLESEKIVDRSSYVYFKPGKLLPKLTFEQSELISFLEKNDKTLVLDLRGNHGGDNTLAHSLAKVLFTKEQIIPSSTTFQVEGPLQKIGACISATIVYGDAVKDYCDRVRELVKDRLFADLLGKSVSKKQNVLLGERALPYKSNVLLLTDSGCASACETIVEKISAHPKAKIYGAHTAGALHFGNAISFTLPNSGIWIKIPTLLEIYENDRKEAMGYLPDYPMSWIDLDEILTPGSMF